MKKDKIWKGKEFNTLEGYEVVTGYNSGTVYTKSYELDKDGNGVKTVDRMLTLNDVEHEMKDVDGDNHKVEYVYLSDMSYWDSDFEDVIKGEYKVFCGNYEDADIQSFIDYLGWQEWMEEYVCSQGYEEFDVTNDRQDALINEYIRKVLS